MENILNALKATQEKNAVEFKNSIHNELVSRLYSALNAKKEGIGKTALAAENTEDVSSKEVSETEEQETTPVTEASVLAPSAPTTGAKAGIPGSERSNSGGAEVPDPLEDGLRDEIETAFGVKGDASGKTVSKDEDISLDPNFEKEFFMKETEYKGHKLTIKQVGLGLSKPVRVYVDGNRWEFFPGPESAMKAARTYVDGMNSETVSNEEFTSANTSMNEKVEIDGRTRVFKTTVARLENARVIRDTKKEDMSSGSMTLSMNNKKMLDAIAMKNGKYVMDEEDLGEDQAAYRKFFNASLKKFGASSPSDLSGEKKKKFFNYIKSNWKG
jgi:hypothetical protein